MKNELGENDLELLSACLDGVCEDPAALRARLNAEPELALRLRQLQAVRARLAAIPAPNPPADFAARVTRRAFARKLPVPGATFWMYALPAAVAVLLVVAVATHRPPKQEAAATDPDAWRIALNAVAESPDAETMAEWIDEEPIQDETSPGDLVGTLADLSAGEAGGLEGADIGGPESSASLIDMMDQMNEVDAAVLAMRLKSGA